VKNCRPPLAWPLIAVTFGLLAFACGGGEAGRGVAPAPAKTITAANVTYADYEGAVLAYIACLKDAGFEVTDPTPVPGQQLTFIASRPLAADAPDFESAGPDELRRYAESRRELTRPCAERYRPVVDAWTTATAPSGEQLDEAREALANCLREAGEDVPQSPSTEDFVQLQQTAAAFPDCSERVGEEYGIPFFGG
jgi:hypothetical protein